ncbi:hypothetical protein FTX61_18955 [Nitriliruptoraceae bacterium ZYF776]|nr:hypothetical protein [Profundirhabdus halotolerans]
MPMRRLAAVTAATLTLGAAVPASAQDAPADPFAGTPAPIDHVGETGSGALELSVLGTYATDVFDASAAEIVAHDPATQRLYVVNAEAGTTEVLDISDPTAPEKVTDLVSATEGGIANSVAINADGLIAVAVEDPVKTDPGTLELWRSVDGGHELLNVLPVGALPDMVTFTPDGTTVLVANEGEPADDFSVDPEGSVSIVDVSGEVAALSGDDVRTADFRDFDGDRELPEGVRVFGPDVAAPAWQGTGEAAPGRIARNLEPEYIVATDATTAYVVLQEANAIAVLDVASATFDEVLPLGRKDHLEPGNEFAASDRDPEISIRGWPVLGMHQPDGFDAYDVDGATYLVTANEGDGRDDWGSYSETARVGSSRVPLCGDAFADFVASQDDLDTVADLRAPQHLGRLNVSTAEGLRAGEDCYEELHVLGARSFSIWSADGELVFDSGSDFERITAEAVPEFFNSNHRENSFQTRSDDKGPEPEDVTIGRVGSRTYAFIGLERIGGVMVYDVTDPAAPAFVRWVNNRDFSAEPGTPEAGDLGSEGLIFIPAEDSPIGVPLLAVANEVSGTTTLWRVDGDEEVVEPPVRPTPPYDRGIDRVCAGVGAPSFLDVAGSVHVRAIACLETFGLTEGTRDPSRFAPRRPVTRAQMASFVARLIESASGAPLPAGPDAFRDDDGSVHEPAIDALAALGVVEGQRGGGFGPQRPISRAQMASLLDRAIDVLDGELDRSAPPATDLDVFGDDDGSVHEAAIDRLAALGIVQGFGDGSYRPSRDVLRDQMASFLARTLDAADELGLRAD